MAMRRILHQDDSIRIVDLVGPELTDSTEAVVKQLASVKTLHMSRDKITESEVTAIFVLRHLLLCGDGMPCGWREIDHGDHVEVRVYFLGGHHGGHP